MSDPADTERRRVVQLLGAGAMIPLAARAPALTAQESASGSSRPCRIRALTAGVALADIDDLKPIESALAMLARGKRRFEDAGYEVQTIRIATTPLVASMGNPARDAALRDLQALDRLVETHEAVCSIGPALLADRVDDQLPAWGAELVRTTRHLYFTVVVATPETGALPKAAQTAGRVMQAIAGATTNGLGNFRFAAIADVPPHAPFVPAAYHTGATSLSIGLESAGVVQRALEQATDAASGTALVRRELMSVLTPVQEIAAAFAKDERREYRGIDPSPAPGQDRSIGAAIEALTHEPFGSASTLEACGAITEALKTLDVRTCGYAGLMLPVLEDPVLARRASEGRYGLTELLLYSSVCGTGLDVVPVPGDTPPGALSRVIRDTAALAAKWRKALSVRLLLVPGKRAGETATFDDPLLTSARVFDVA